MGKMTGMSDIRRNMREFTRQYPEIVGTELVEELKEVELPETQRRIPVDTGTAHDTGEVVGPEITPGRVEAGIVYGRDPTVQNPKGGYVKDYIIPLHEDLEALHPNGGEAKFVESVWNESQPHILSRVAVRCGVDKVKL